MSKQSDLVNITQGDADINGGTIDGTVIGGSTPAAISGTTGQFGTSLNVDGTITSDGLTVDGDGLFDNDSAKVEIKSFNPRLTFTDDSAVDAAADKFIIQSVSGQSLGDYEFVMNNDQTSSADVTVAKFYGGGDIAFYEDTGTTPKFFWDASAEALGIGTNSPERPLHVAGTSKFDDVIFAYNEIRVNSSGNAPSAGQNSIVYAGARIDLAGFSTTFASVSDQVLLLNRMGTDGAVITFYNSGTGAGSISVSGTTVTYGGGHLARWSRLPSEERADIPKGTVMTNLDAMVVWEKPDGTIEPNEQLNQTEISSVEGDPNVAGVFDHWDNDDEQGYDDDFYLALTGDFIIRIAQGVTVQRGDLLMSAGDGTAKPQGDDIVRSKTIAKVTSTHVTCTYEDGSYCVPCVLMAC